MNRKYRNFILGCIATQYYKLDLDKDYFLLSSQEIKKVDELRQACRHRYNKYSGKSKCRDFWDYLRKREIPF